jgi:hypothetical protein
MEEHKVTTKHEEIKSWAEKHKAVPELIDDIDSTGDIIGIRLEFPGHKDDFIMDETKHRKVTWEDWFERFEEMKLAFVYEENKKDNPGMAYRFIPRENMDLA